jgi:hypothetical protein
MNGSLRFHSNDRARWALSMLASFLGWLAPGSLATPHHTQVISLQPGWNAVHLEVTPTNTAIEQVFAGLPVESVWTYAARLTSVQFISDPFEPVWNRSSWRVWVPTNRTDSYNNDLFAVRGNRPYLIHCTNTAPVLWNLTGTVEYRALTWVPDAFNLQGFPIDPAQRPTFANFFRKAGAHFDSASGQMRGAYRLNSSGQWVPVTPGEFMDRGIAYWVFSKGASDFTAPLALTSVPGGGGLNFAAGLSELPLGFKNNDFATRTISVADAIAPSALSYYGAVTNSDPWFALPAPYNVTLATNRAQTLRLALRRQDFLSTYQSLLTIRDGAGTLYRLPLEATNQSPAGITAPPVAPVDQARLHAGLWVGSVSLNAVSEVNSGNLVTNPLTHAVTRVGVSTNPTPTRSEATLRLLLHVDTNGTTRLLKEVIQMWQDGITGLDSNGLDVVVERGRFVLLTDDRLIPQFRGAALRDGVPVGRRLSTVGYDFEAGPGATTLPMAGHFAISNKLSATLTLSATAPTNPFRHQYHPDHDNLDATFRNFKAEAYAVARHIELRFAASDPTGRSAPSFGHDTMAGTYREHVSGLHKDDIHVAGTFRLQRVAITPVLNQ